MMYVSVQAFIASGCIGVVVLGGGTGGWWYGFHPAVFPDQQGEELAQDHHQRSSIIRHPSPSFKS